MKTRIIRIGNSQGIRIPKSFLQGSKITDEVRLEAFHKYIVIRPADHHPRKGWENAFRALGDCEENESLDR
jgi:antitoxin MazE